MKLRQGQIWRQAGQYIRIVRLERLEVEYKSMASLRSKDGKKIVTSKKDFCRLLKQATLLEKISPDRIEPGEAGAANISDIATS